MLTRDMIETMDGPARTRAFRDLVEIVYGTREPEREKICYDLDITPPTYRRWMRETCAPVWAILLMNEWAHHGETVRQEFIQWTEIIGKLSEITSDLRGLARLRAAATFQCVSGASATDAACPE